MQKLIGKHADTEGLGHVWGKSCALELGQHVPALPGSWDPSACCLGGPRARGLIPPHLCTQQRSREDVFFALFIHSGKRPILVNFMKQKVKAGVPEAVKEGRKWFNSVPKTALFNSST